MKIINIFLFVIFLLSPVVVRTAQEPEEPIMAVPLPHQIKGENPNNFFEWASECIKIKEVVAFSAEDDVIIFKLQSNGEDFPYIPMSNAKLSIGDKTYAIGSPRNLTNTFSSGEISQLRGDNIIQISTPIDHGSSGGVLLNEYGEAIGITSSGYDDSVANLNFAINIKIVNKYL